MGLRKLFVCRDSHYLQVVSLINLSKALNYEFKSTFGDIITKEFSIYPDIDVHTVILGKPISWATNRKSFTNTFQLIDAEGGIELEGAPFGSTLCNK